MLHYRENLNDEKAVCGANIFEDKGEDGSFHSNFTVFRVKVTCTECRAKVKPFLDQHEMKFDK